MLDKVFSSVGEKIKLLAKVVFVGGGVIGVVGGLAVLLWPDADLYALGAIILVVVPLSAWIGGLFLYGFGELVARVCAIEGALCREGLTETAEKPMMFKRELELKQLRETGMITEEEYRQALEKK